MSKKNEKLFYCKQIVCLDEGFFCSKEYEWLWQQEDGPMAFGLYVHLTNRYKGLREGLLEDNRSNDPSEWIPATAESIQRGLPGLTVEQVERSLHLLRYCGLLKWRTRTFRPAPRYMLSAREDVYVMTELRHEETHENFIRDYRVSFVDEFFTTEYKLYYPLANNRDATGTPEIINLENEADKA